MAEITYMKTPAETKLGEQFRALTLPEAETAPRTAAFEAFATKGLPHRRIEAWHYTDLRSLMRDALPPAPPVSLAELADVRARIGSATGPQVVLVDGAFVPGLSALDSLPNGVTVEPVLDGSGRGPARTAGLQAAEQLGITESVLALNSAFLQGGVAITVPAGVDASVIEILSVATGATPSAMTTRSTVDVGAGGKASIVERALVLGGAETQGNHALVLSIADDAVLHHTASVEGGAPGSIHLGTVLANLGARARLMSFTLSAAPGIVRRQSFVQFSGDDAASRLNGVTLLEGRAHADTTLVVTHKAEGCESREYYKTILDDESTGVYQGKVVVAPGAQKTDGKMLSKAVFLADGASMYNKPELEIFADDVVCGHGATVGYLDEEQLFYLRARGIPLREAQSLLLNAFAADSIDDVEDEAMRERLTETVHAWLARRHL